MPLSPAARALSLIADPSFEAGTGMGVALGFMYGVWICLAAGVAYVMAKAMQDPPDDH